MKGLCYSSKLLLLLLFPFMALAGPEDVEDESATEKELLKYHHIIHELKLPTAPQPKAPPPPPPEEEEDDTIENQDEGSISISDTGPPIDTLGESQYFKNNVWRYLSDEEAVELLNRLPNPTPASILRDTTHRLLLSKGQQPRGMSRGWLKHRAAALLRMGAVSYAASLLNTVPKSYRDMEFIPFYAYAHLLSNRTEDACETIRMLPVDIEAQFQRLQIFCDALRDDFGKAELALSLKEEQGVPAPDWFATLIDSLHYTTATASSPEKDLKSTDLAMWLYSGESALGELFDKKHFLKKEQILYHSLIGTNSSFTPKTRALFLESAVQYDPVLRGKLEALYHTAKSTQLTPLGKHIKSLQVIKNATKAAKPLAETFEYLEKNATPSLADATLLSSLNQFTRRLKAREGYLNFAPKAFAMLMRAQDIRSTKKWLAIMDRYRSNAVYTYLAHELARFANIKNGKQQSNAAQLLPSFSIPEEANETERRALYRFFKIMRLFGYALSGDTTTLLEETDTDSDKSETVKALEFFRKRGSVAGTLLTALNARGDKHLSNIDDAEIIATLKALKGVGHEDIAHQYAIESIVAFF